MMQRQEQPREPGALRGLLIVGLLFLFAHWFGGLMAAEPTPPDESLSRDTSAITSAHDADQEALAPFYQAMFHLLNDSLDRCGCR